MRLDASNALADGRRHELIIITRAQCYYLLRRLNDTTDMLHYLMQNKPFWTAEQAFDTLTKIRDNFVAGYNSFVNSYNEGSDRPTYTHFRLQDADALTATIILIACYNNPHANLLPMQALSDLKRNLEPLRSVAGWPELRAC